MSSVTLAGFHFKLIACTREQAQHPKLTFVIDLHFLKGKITYAGHFRNKLWDMISLSRER